MMVNMMAECFIINQPISDDRRSESIGIGCVPVVVPHLGTDVGDGLVHTSEAENLLPRCGLVVVWVSHWRVDHELSSVAKLCQAMPR